MKRTAMTPGLKSLALAFLTLALPASRASAQFEQYTPLGSFEETRESMDELLERSMKEARWRWGRVFVHPWVGIPNLAYADPLTDSAGNETSDFTVSIGAGIRAYAPVGRELTLAVHALPEYVWWRDLSERRQLNGRYGAGLFGNLGRTGLELTATRDEDARYVSREIEELVNTRDDSARLAVEVDVGRGVSVFGEGSVRELRFVEGMEVALQLRELERDEEILRAGLRVELPRGLILGVGVESSEVDFTVDDSRSHSGTSPIVQLDYDASPFQLEVHLAFRDLEADPGSRFVAYDEVTGSLRASWQISDRTEIQLFGNRNLVYSAEDRWAYFEDTGFGLAVRTALTSQVSVRVHAEQGDNAYVSFQPQPPERSDDYVGFGGQVEVGLGRMFFTLGVSTTDYESNFLGRGRSTTSIRSGLTLGSRGGSPWG